MTGKKTPIVCACGCNAVTCGDEFIQGHDSFVFDAIIRHVGGISNLRKIVERITGAPIVVQR